MKNKIEILLALGKARITFAVAISSALGYILSLGSVDFQMLSILLAVFILACGSSALNQWQERKYDALMDRTKSRPIPSGEITANQGLAISIAMIVIGLAMLLTLANLTAFFLGIAALVWYNLVYSLLKRKTSLAVVPGALIGALPPAIGWTAAGGDISDPRLAVLGLFFFIWQIPHFWLLVLIFDKDYEKAGFPTLTQLFKPAQLTRITYTWIVALAASCMLLPLFDLSNGLATAILLLVSGFWLSFRSKSILSQFDSKKSVRNAFMNVNFYVLAVTLFLSIDKLLKF